MKTLLKQKLLCGLILTGLLLGCNSQSEKAASYNNDILSHQMQISDAIDSLKQSFRKHEAVNMDRAMVNLKKSVYDGLGQIDRMGPFGKDTIFKHEARVLFQSYENLCKNEFPNMVSILEIPDSTFSTEDQSKLFQIQSQMNTLIKESEEKFKIAQKDFGEKYNLEFVLTQEEK